MKVVVMHARQRHVFGPVWSRRLGRSLGIDLVPYKTCSYDCIYCQLGATTHQTVERGRFVSVSAILGELERRLRPLAKPDYVTLSGAGEPTLQIELEALIRGIKRITDCPVAVLTNGSLLWREDVQAELMDADLVMPSLDAGDERMFRRVNRPHPQLRFERVVEGLGRFRQRFQGRIWLEVFILAGLTATTRQIAKIQAVTQHIAFDRIQVNTATRPPCEPFALPASCQALARAARSLGERADIIAERGVATTDAAAEPRAAQIVDLLGRRPCTLDDLASGLGLRERDVARCVNRLLRARAIVVRQYGSRVYYQRSERDVAARTGIEQESEGQT